MKLIELLGKHMNRWPEGYSRVIQNKYGNVLACKSFGYRFVFLNLSEIADDRETSVVTFDKWNAQRAHAQQK